MDPRSNKNNFIDSHCHLPLLKEATENIINQCKKLSVTRILNVGYDIESSLRSIALAKQYDMIDASIGIHPHYVGSDFDGMIQQLIEMIVNFKVAAIGEIGLDSIKSTTAKTIQLDWLEAQISLADKNRLPIIIHNRSSDKDIDHILTKKTSCKGVLHCFSSEKDFAFKMIDLGWYLSFSGNITYPKNDHLREIVKEVPIQQLLLETDAPYLTPNPFRGKRENSPELVVGIYEFVADLRKEILDDMSWQISTNYQTLFNGKKEG